MSRRRPAQHGIAALELLLLLPVLLLFLAGMVYFGRYYTYYSVAHKAAHDAARYLSTVTRREMRLQVAGSTQVPALQLAQYIAQQETAGLSPGPAGVSVAIYCLPIACSGMSVPEKVRVMVQMRVTDQLLAPFSWGFVSDEGILLLADVTLLYVGQ